MCLEIQKRNLPFLGKIFGYKGKIAKKDIICYKYYETYGSCGDGGLRSTIQHTRHYLGIQPKVKLGIGKYGNSISVYEGYHSFIEAPSKTKRYDVYLCIIPKGARYFKGGINNVYKIDGYVSNQIIIKEKIE